MKTTDKTRNDSLIGGEAEEAKTMLGSGILDECGPNAKKLTLILVPVFAIIWFMFSFGYYDIPYRGIYWNGRATRVFGPKQPKAPVMDNRNSSETKIDRLLGGLLAPAFAENSCKSRYNSALYRKPSSQNPSALLISKLRAYEALHKRCGPNTEPYRKAVDNIKSGKQSGSSDCNYVVWISYNGLGNRILTLASTFLYALLTNRVLLVDRGKDTADLFCEPFPDTSWLLPIDFPLITKIGEFNQRSNFSYGNMLKADVYKNNSDATIPSSLYLYLGSTDSDGHDKRFFYEQNNSLFKNVPWLIIKTDAYFIPSLFLTPSFEQELSNLFPKKESIFQFLGRYLFHPTNQVWGLITRFYDAYLENAHEKIGVQIRLLEPNPDDLQYVFDQVLSCLVKETKLIPNITKQEHILGPKEERKKKTILVTSLYSAYYERLRDMYWENPTTTGDVIRFFQPSYEKHEQNKNKIHNMKAWAEIYLLSLTDKLVTSSRSTFGYVAQGLGELRPWILYMPQNQTVPNPPCHRGISLEPCFFKPTDYDFNKGSWINTGGDVPYIKDCEDASFGQKLFDVEK